MSDVQLELMILDKYIARHKAWFGRAEDPCQLGLDMRDVIRELLPALDEQEVEETAALWRTRFIPPLASEAAVLKGCDHAHHRFHARAFTLPGGQGMPAQARARELRRMLLQSSPPE